MARDNRHDRGDRGDRLALLERQLRALGPQLAVPDARGIAPAVRRRLESGATTVDVADVPRSHTRRRVLVAVAAILFVVVATTLAVNKSRDAVADWLGLRGVEIEHSQEPVRGLGSTLHLGRQVSLAEARAALDFEPLVAARAQYGRPDAIYLADTPDGGRVTFLYAPRPGLVPAAGSGVGLLITEFEATVQEPVLRKTAGPDTTVEVLDINGQRAYWLEGEPHGVVFTDRNGKMFQDEARVAGNTLLFGNGSRTIRIESGLTKAEALALAAALERA
jgi:catechol 2,3-dioxygenase-like lactoylglutathione lyase family enzyme